MSDEDSIFKEDDRLDDFSWNFYTFINQIFGDYDVRMLIGKYYKNDQYKFCAPEAGTGDFQGSDHHILKRYDGSKWDSVEEGIQDTGRNKEDTLCQSYTITEFISSYQKMHGETKTKKFYKTNPFKTHRNIVEVYQYILTSCLFVFPIFEF